MGFRATLKFRTFLAGHNVVVVTYCVTKMITACSPMAGQFFDTMIVAASVKSGYSDPSKYKCQKFKKKKKLSKKKKNLARSFDG